MKRLTPDLECLPFEQRSAVVMLYAQRGEEAARRKLQKLQMRNIVQRVQRKLYWDMVRFTRSDERIAAVCRQAWRDAEMIFSPSK